jgi:Tfp pilus assembly protein PilZ
MGLPRGAGIQTLQFKDKGQLYASYMPFIKGGGLFFLLPKYLNWVMSCLR